MELHWRLLDRPVQQNHSYLCRPLHCSMETVNKLEIFIQGFGICTDTQISQTASSLSAQCLNNSKHDQYILNMGEDLFQVPTSYHFIYHFGYKRHPFHIPSTEKWHPFNIYNYSRLPITQTLANSNLVLTRTKINFPWISIINSL